MPRYLFNVHTPHGLERDLEGTELPSLEAVRKEAFVASKRMIAAFLRSGMPLNQALSRTFEIADETGQVVLTVPFSEGAQADLTKVSIVP